MPTTTTTTATAAATTTIMITTIVIIIIAKGRANTDQKFTTVSTTRSCKNGHSEWCTYQDSTSKQQPVHRQ